MSTLNPVDLIEQLKPYYWCSISDGYSWCTTVPAYVHIELSIDGNDIPALNPAELRKAMYERAERAIAFVLKQGYVECQAPSIEITGQFSYQEDPKDVRGYSGRVAEIRCVVRMNVELPK